MSFESDIEKARREIAEIAHSMLIGARSFIEGARSISRLRGSAKIADFDPDFLAFIGIDSETDDLPLGEVRQYWESEALAKLQPKIEQAEKWARDFGRPHCQPLIDRFGAKLD